MGIDDMFKGSHHKHKEHYHGHHDHHRHHDSHDHDGGHYYRQGDHSRHGGRHGHYKAEMILSLLRSLPHKKAIIIGVAIAFLLLFILGIALLWAVIPMIAGALGLVDMKSIQELAAAILSLIQNFAKGG